MTVQFHLLVMNFISLYFPILHVFRKFRVIKIAEDFENLRILKSLRFQNILNSKL